MHNISLSESINSLKTKNKKQTLSNSIRSPSLWGAPLWDTNCSGLIKLKKLSYTSDVTISQFNP